MSPISTGAGFEPNFFSDYSVILNHPLADVFAVIGTSAGHERVTRLSSMCSGFELLNADTVSVAPGTSLKDITVRTTVPSNVEDTSTRHLPRQFFVIHENVAVVPGLINTQVSLEGTLTWDEESKVALYESRTRSGVRVTVWKLRVFEELEGNRTKVTETIRGKCSVWVKGTVQSQARSGHICALRCLFYAPPPYSHSMEPTPPPYEKDAQEKPANSLPSDSEKDVVQHSDTVFEDYLHYAAIQRRFEDSQLAPDAQERKGNWMTRFSDHKGANVNISVRDVNDPSVVEDSERVNALRALRTASWASVFYLITTDILGPFNAPFAISQVGWVPGVILYFFMGLAALYCGLILWRLYIRLDSLKYPLKTYADIAERIFGKTARHVGTICLGNGQALSQMSKNRNFTWLANSAVWINLLIIFISMGVVAHSPPNFEAAFRAFGVPEGPVVTAAFEPLPLFLKMAEMRRPMDFWKGMAMAQALIFVAYLLFGAFFYAFQGQFTLPLAFQGLSNFAWQTVGK
ncbi:hypothetical protein DXG01_007188 [Tephrocybe rancida]|nr:hypothetical protein DXG01_007188 [Tephrocybe rancida]